MIYITLLYDEKKYKKVAWSCPNHDFNKI